MWKYTGDVNIKEGGVYYFDDGSDLSPDYMRAVRVTPATDGGGMDNRFMIEDGSVYMPSDDLARMRNTADTCGYSLDDNKALFTGRDTHEFQSPEWRALMFDAWLTYWGMDGATQTVVQIGTEMPDTSRRSEFLDEAEPDYKLRSNVNFRNWVERTFHCG